MTSSGTGWAVGDLAGGPIRCAGELTRMRAWSTMKVPVIVATLQARRAGELPGASEPTPEERDAIEAAITRSDNEAALTLWDELGDAAAAAARTERVLREAGDDSTTVPSTPDPRGYSPFGRTVWPLDAAATFYRALALGRLLSPADTELVLDAMSRVVPEQRWGIGAAEWEAAPPLRFKGGWGPSDADSGAYELLQVGLIGAGRDGLVVAIAATAPDYEAATEMATLSARALAAPRLY